MSTSTNPLRRKSIAIEFNPSQGPSANASILELFRSNTAAHYDTSNEWIIDVFPNMTPILMYVMLNSIRDANAAEVRNFSKASVATICMYHMTIVYGFFLINDAYIRPTPSAHARSWLEISWKREFLDFIQGLPIPDFLEPILSQLCAFETERTKNVFFVPSAAGYDHDQFFGRVYPLNMFAAIHDCTATLPGNSTKTDVLHDLYSRVLYTITEPAYECLIPDLIGVTIDQTTNTNTNDTNTNTDDTDTDDTNTNDTNTNDTNITVNHMNSKLYQVFNAVINPILFRDFQRRSSLAALSFGAPTFASANVNAYDMMFSATAPNLRELKVVIQSIQSAFASKMSTNATLDGFIQKAHSSSIIKHGYSTYALPTWSHSEDETKQALFTEATTFTLISEDLRAQDFSFLQRPNAPIPHAHKFPDVIPDVDVLRRIFPGSIVENAEATAPFPAHDNEDLVKFTEELHTDPSVLVLDTDNEHTLTAHLPLLAGKIVESFELDGSTIEMPNASKSLGMQNCMFADSAIPYKYVRPGSSFRPVAARSVLPPLNRALPNSRPRLPASSLLRDRTAVMLPNVNPTVNVEPRPDQTLPGLTRIHSVVSLRYSQSFLGFRTVDGSANTAALDEVPEMSEGLLLLWSPYTYTPYESDDHPAPNHGESRHYYLTNLRTIFGTNFNLIKAKHPYESLPVV